MQNDFKLHFINLGNQFNATFQFYSENHFIRFLKVLTIIIFFSPTIVMSLIMMPILLVHTILKHIPFIGLISGTIASLANMLLAAFFDACNLPEIKRYREQRIIVTGADLEQVKAIPPQRKYCNNTKKQNQINNAIEELTQKIDNIFADIEEQELFSKIKNDTIKSIKIMAIRNSYEVLSTIEDINMDYWAFTSISGQILTMIINDTILDQFSHLNYHQALGLSRYTLSELHCSCAQIALNKGIITEADFNDLVSAAASLLG